jgi:Ca-activated chloride channel family protein
MVYSLVVTRGLRDLSGGSGTGRTFSETILQGMADAGGGHFYYMERLEQITDLITSEVGELLDVVARDAAIELIAPDPTTIRPLSPTRSQGAGGSVPLREAREPL